MTPDQPLVFLQADSPNALKRLCDLLAIPSISTSPAHKQDVARAAQWVAATLTDSGLTASIEPTPGHPVVLAKSNPAIVADPDHAPRILFYGHYDVQPPDPLDQWTSPPFQPTIRGSALYARGASDDKGQIACFFETLHAYRQTQTKLPVHVTVLIEGEEEMGSINLHPFIKARKNDLAADIVVVSDTAMWNKQTPAITYGLRGMVYYDVQLHNPNRDLHSGVYGGTLANPTTMLTQVLGRLFDSNHRVTIPGFYDDVLPTSPEELARWNDLHFDEFEHCLTPIGVKVPFGEAGFSTLQRRWTRPCCDINGLFGGYAGPGAKTVIPSFAGAKVSFRLAPNQSASKIASAFEAWLRSHDVHGCTWKLTNLGGSDPVVLPYDSPYVAAASRAFQTATGKKPVLMREGATIPVVSDFKKILGLDALLIGFGLHDDCLHSPNEKFDLDCFSLGCRTHTALLAELASVHP